MTLCDSLSLIQIVTYSLMFGLGYRFGSFVGGSDTGKPGRVHWTWFLQTFQIHIHHWFIFTVLFIVLWWTNFMNILLGCFLCGGIVQGLTYSDRFDFRVYTTPTHIASITNPTHLTQHLCLTP